MKAAMIFLQAARPDVSGYVVREGQRLRSEDVRRVIERQLLESDCVADEIIVAGGSQGAEPHERGSGLLRAGWPIVIDIFPRHKPSGYWGDLTRTVFVGRPKEEMRLMWRAVRAAQLAALNKIRSGVQVRQVHQAAQRVLVEHGFETIIHNGVGEGFIHSTGHGIGLDIHEAPSINLSDARLRVGDVVTVEPGLYYKRLGGVRIEDTVEVTKDGYRVLVPCPYGRV
jgi:Xaa-Pro aminopeptidase